MQTREARGFNENTGSKKKGMMYSLNSRTFKIQEESNS